MASPTTNKIAIPGLSLNVKSWGNADGIPVLGMHGWLDNAATFDLLAPYLPTLNLVSVDLPGHGFSDHLPPCSSYNLTDAALQMLQLADALGWNKFSVMGHSLGGVVGQMMAAIAPERIDKLVLIDIFGAIPYPPDVIVTQIKKYLQASKSIPGHSIYRSLDQAAEVRATVNPALEISLSAARTLVEGGMQKVNDGYRWTFDRRLLLPTAVMLTTEQVQTVLTSISADCTVVKASKGILSSHGEWAWRPEDFPNVKIVECEGGHHLHLDNPAPVANIINHFITK